MVGEAVRQSDKWSTRQSVRQGGGEAVRKTVRSMQGTHPSRSSDKLENVDAAVAVMIDTCKHLLAPRAKG